MEKKWIIAEEKSDDLLTQLLLNRGLDSEPSRHDFLNPSSPQVLTSQSHKIFGVAAEETAAAASIIKEALASGRTIIIHGDYDVDGLCATAILWETLYFGLGYRNVHPFIPDRFADGYGLSRQSLEKINQQYNKLTAPPLLIAVDCGVTAAKEVADAQELGMAVLVVDHHRRPEVLPNAQGLVWSDKVCAAGLAWLLGYQLSPEISPSQLDLAALATLADLQPLLGVNRSLVKFGLEVLNRTPRLGLKILAEAAGLIGKKIGTYEVGWVIAPRLNAAGRLQSALDSLRLLCTRDRAQAQEIVIKLNKLNFERQQMTLEATTHAKESYLATRLRQGFGGQVEQSSKETRRIIFVHHETYHEGVIGLVAGKLVQEFNRPALVLSQGEIYSKGSARSVPGFDLVAALQKLAHLFEDLGGHPMAAGFTIKNEKIAQLEEALPSLVTEELVGELSGLPLLVDAPLLMAQVNLELLETLKKLEPYGVGNPQPLFLSSNVSVLGAQTVGAEGKHLKLRLVDNGKECAAIWFGEGGRLSSFPPGILVDIVYTPMEDSWNGSSRLSLQIKDMRLVN